MMKRKTAKISTKPTGTSACLPKKPRLDAQARTLQPDSWQDFFDSELRPTDDFMEEHVHLPVQERKSIRSNGPQTR